MMRHFWRQFLVYLVFVALLGGGAFALFELTVRKADGQIAVANREIAAASRQARNAARQVADLRQQQYEGCLASDVSRADTNAHVRGPLKSLLEYLTLNGSPSHRHRFAVAARQITLLPIPVCVKPGT